MKAQPEISLIIANDGGQAVLVVPPSSDPSLLKPELLRLQVSAAGVSPDREGEQALAAVPVAYGQGKSELRVVVARAVPPVPGKDGCIEWRDGMDPCRGFDQPGSEKTDHYRGRRFTLVKTGEVVGVLHAPTGGTDGRDVRGGVIRARPGKPAPFSLHPTLTLDSARRIVAQSDGVLVMLGSKLVVTQSLDVPGNVDFTTGNIDYPFAVSVAGGVGTGFKVRAGGDLRVGGLIEAAEIGVGGDLEARGGMAGEQRGTIDIAGSASIVYLDRVTGRVGGDLCVEREIVDCRVSVGRDLRCANGTVFGGEISVAGSLLVKTIGSESYAPTALILGDVPELQIERAGLVKAVKTLDAAVAQCDEQTRLIRMNPRPSAPEKEKLTELLCECSQHHQELARSAKRLAEIDAAIGSRRKLDVQVAKKICPGTTLRIGDFTAVFKTEAKGPISICWDEKRNLVYRDGSGVARPLSEIAQVRRNAASAPPERPALPAAA